MRPELCRLLADFISSLASETYDFLQNYADLCEEFSDEDCQEDDEDE